jgi:hypothetical protein
MTKESKMGLFWILAGVAVVGAVAATTFRQYMGSRAFRGLDRDVLNVVEFFKRKS